MLRRPPRSTRTDTRFPYTTLFRSAIFALGEGVGSVVDIDKGVMLGLNHPMGPLTLADLVGLDTCLEICTVLQGTTGDPKYRPARSEEHTSELQSLMRNSYAVFGLNKKNNTST